MSAYTKRKHVSKEVEEFDDLPTDKSLVKIIGGKGNNLHLVKTDNGEEYLVSMPTKFRKHVWVKRGDFVLVEPIEEGDKVKAEISHVLLKPHIKQLKKDGKWPKIFDDEEEESKTVIDDTVDDDDEYASDDSSLNLEENPNHANYDEEQNSDEYDDDSSSSEEEDENNSEEGNASKEDKKPEATS